MLLFHYLFPFRLFYYRNSIIFILYLILLYEYYLAILFNYYRVVIIYILKRLNINYIIAFYSLYNYLSDFFFTR